jgi:DNA (cytosine-5)-methyltransferase 1
MDIRSLRIEQKLRLKDLANKADVALTDLRKCERGLLVPDHDFFVTISKVLGVDAVTLRDAQAKLSGRLVPGEGYTTAKASRKLLFQRKAQNSSTKIRVMDLFCGTGGFSHGFELTGAFQVTTGLDLLEDRIRTFSKNHPGANCFASDIRDIDVNTILEHDDIPEVIIGGPPCQGFSSIRPFRNLTEKDLRNNLFESFAVVVKKIKPKWFVLENVVGLLTHEKGKTLKAIIQLFEQAGYKVTWKVLNAALYGLPQRRERLLIVGSREGKQFFWPEPTYYFHGRSMAGKVHGQNVQILPLFSQDFRPAVTVVEAIHDLPEIGSGMSCSEYRNDIVLTDYEKLMRGNSTKLTMHEATRHSERMLEIIRQAGYNRYDLPEGLTSSGFSSSYSRIEPNSPSVTLTVNFVHPASNKCIHPYQDRALTPREGARLQGFEDNYVFIGSRAQIVKQIGNAVPPLLGKIIAQSLLDHI